MQVPVVIVSARAAKRVRDGHPWVYRTDLAAKQLGKTPEAALVHVKDEKGNHLGDALSSSSSQIALRMVTDRDKLVPEQLPRLIRERVLAAAEYRKQVVRDSEAYRLVFSEADRLPGLIADRYGDVVTIQFQTQAMDREDLRAAALAAVTEGCGEGVSVVERVEPRIRELEELPARESGLLAGKKTKTLFRMNALEFEFDALGGQKTGAFLDQRENYLAAQRWAHGDALDVCCYHGGFALHLGRVSKSVTGIDLSRPALEQAEANAQRNAGQLKCGEIEWLEGNAFDVLKDWSSAGKQFDTIVLDPPAFAKSRKALETAVRGYKEMNLRALKMLRPGGVLVTCSCSHHVKPEEFMAMLQSAAADAHKTVRLLEIRGQALDHPVVLAIPETLYLKCVILQAI